jgi:DNA-binding CsgD family transcriptional regulator
MTIFDIALDHERERLLARNPYRLSPAELEVATLIGQGLSSLAVSEKLSMSDAAVETHRARIMTKVGARNGPHLVYILGTLARAQPIRPDIVHIEDFRDAFGRTPQSAANSLAQGGLTK